MCTKKFQSNLRPCLKVAIFIGIILLFAFFIISYQLSKQLIQIYESRNSPRILDRYGDVIALQQNPMGHYAQYIQKLPPRFKELLLQKEDRYFYLHWGVNPWSILQDFFHHLGIGQRNASSTLTQQLVKVLLRNETERSVQNKIEELFYTLALEIYQSKEDILRMYTNSISFGNQAQGINQASQLYFGIHPELLTDDQILQLLATINSPTTRNPAESSNTKAAQSLAKALKVNARSFAFLESREIKRMMKDYSRETKSFFEISSLIRPSSPFCKLTIDQEVGEKVRKIVERNLTELKVKHANHAAAVILKLPENELLALIGSPNPQSLQEGYQINMALQPRAIGSTIKPFIYLKAFEKGLRPYTLVDDREYKYITAIGFPLYPKNFDSQYRGKVTLHYALSNSLNVPSVKVLEYIGLQDFYTFLREELGFTPVQDLENYQLGIALGSLEMNLFELSRYFTVFPNNGTLKDIKVFQAPECAKEEFLAQEEKRIADPSTIQLINKILTDRKTSIDQFGLKSELNLFQSNYALKTGTSRDFRDSWVIGYTPDFLVGVWVGNADTSPTEELSGQLGAGKIWAETMDLLLNSPYNKKTPFIFSSLKEFSHGESIEYGLPGDRYDYYRNLFANQDTSLILNPHDGDFFRLEKNIQISLKAKEQVQWFINKEFFSFGDHVIFVPPSTGQYTIQAKNRTNLGENITISVIE